MKNTIKKILVLIPFALAMGGLQTQAFGMGISSPEAIKKVDARYVLAQHTMPLGDRYAVPSVNTVFRDNILLALAYMAGTVKSPNQINWDTLHKPTTYDLTLQPGEVFAFQDAILPEFAGKKIVTTNAHFDGSEGFVSDGYLYGDGVCHFASLITWVASDAGLKVVAPTRHDFAKIPDIDRIYGTSIYAGDPRQNLYVENTFDKPIHLIFTYENDAMTVRVEK
jgi:VanW like protein